MSEYRPSSEIQSEANQIMYQIGGLEFQKHDLDEKIQNGFKKLKSLNTEMLGAKAYEAKLQSELEAKKNEESKS
jgi:hypothetical protein